MLVTDGTIVDPDSSQDSLLLEETLRSQPFARLGMKALGKKRGQAHNCEPAVVTGRHHHRHLDHSMDGIIVTSICSSGMEGMVKKYQQKFRKVKDEMSQWDELQSRLLSQFRNASSIIERLQLIQNPKNYGPLKCVGGIEDAVLRKQMESLENILLSMNNTMKEFHSIVFFLEKTLRDGRQLVKGGSVQATPKQLQQRIGIKPCLADCLDGLSNVYEMHHSEYLLKSSIVSALPALALKPSGSDLGALQQLLVDQPNIPRDEVQLIFDIVFAEEIC